MAETAPAQPAQVSSPATAPTSASPTPAASPAVATPVADAAAPAAPAPEAPAPDAAAPTETTFLGSTPEPTPDPPKQDPAPAAEVKPAEEPKKEEASQSVEPAPLPTYEAFTLPDTFKSDDLKLGEFTKDLAEFERTSKADHAEMQKFGQKLVDRYVAEVQDLTKRLSDYQTTAWEKQKSDWKAALKQDPVIGGTRIEATKASINKAFNGAPAEDIKAFNEYMNASGIGDNPAVARMFAYLSDKANRLSQEDSKPLPGTKPQPATKSKIQKFYGNSGL